MSLSRQHFRELAALVARYGQNGGAVDVATLARDLSTFCADYNPRFSRTRFLEACELPDNPTTRKVGDMPDPTTTDLATADDRVAFNVANPAQMAPDLEAAHDLIGDLQARLTALEAFVFGVTTDDVADRAIVS